MDKALKRVITESPEAKEKINTQIVWDTLEDLGPGGTEDQFYWTIIHKLDIGFGGSSRRSKRRGSRKSRKSRKSRRSRKSLKARKLRGSRKAQKSRKSRKL